MGLMKYNLKAELISKFASKYLHIFILTLVSSKVTEYTFTPVISINSKHKLTLSVAFNDFNKKYPRNFPMAIECDEHEN